ncbi:MAG: 1,4-beta-mannosyl-N-acetylglucosamine phosphorylase [Dehalococcoidia bacterium]|nr:1,4-beta-mannosyl-N-acetylglucosamine phosphorylase [Bacillota bacterium]
MNELEAVYHQSLSRALEKTAEMEKVDLVVGIPFLNGGEDAQIILSILEAGLDTFYPDLNCLIVCALCPSVSSIKTFESARLLQTRLDKGLSGRGWAVRSLMDVAHSLTADLVIVEPSLLTAKSNGSREGLTADLVKLMYQPVRDGRAHFVLPRFKLSHISNSIGDHLVFPLLASLYNVELRGCLDAGMTMSRQLLANLLEDVSSWSPELYEYGINYWLVMRVLELKADIAEVFLGTKPKTTLPVGLDYMFNQAVHAVFQAIGKGQDVWKHNPQAVRSVLTIGPRHDLFLQELPLEPRLHINQFRRGFNRYYEGVWSRIFSEEFCIFLKEAATASEEDFSFPSALWAQLIYESLIAYHFMPMLAKEDLASSLTTLFEGRLAGFLKEISSHKHYDLSEAAPELIACPFNARNNLETQNDAFISRKHVFLGKWLHHKAALLPFLPEIAYWEYIPGIPIILPHLVRSASGKSAHVAGIYERLLKEYKEGFETFARQTLNLSSDDGFEKLGTAMRSLVEQVEKDLDQILLPGNLHTLEGMQNVADRIFALYPAPESLSLKEEVAAWLLRVHPPRNLITLWGYYDTDELLKHHSPLDVLALASWSEVSKYNTRNNEWLKEHLQPEHFEMSPIQPLVVNYSDFPALSGMQEAASLCYLTSRVVVSNQRRGSGGSFPKTRILTIILKSIIEAEQFGDIWESFRKQPGKNFGAKVINSIEGHWGVSLFSGHSIFENMQQERLKSKLLEISRQDWGSTNETVEEARNHLARMAAVYHMGITLPDGYFITCSLWSWASYSFKGGKGIPTPLSLMVERRWFSSELFYRCYEHVIGGRNEVLPKIAELMGQGRESENLAALFLGAPPDGAKIIIKQKIEKVLPQAGSLVRSPFNPILTSIAEHHWESKYVLNCGAIRVKGNVYIFYRGVGEDGVSRIGLAISKNGHQVDERLPEPVFGPAHESESMGCEDPRLIAIEGRIYMLYTAYDGIIPQIALASIAEDDLIQQRWQHWHRHGLVFPGFINKNAVLFPERFNGKLAMYHRIAPSIWVTFASTFDTPWSREGHKLIMGSRSGMMWDAVKIGSGAPPLKTRFGWLLIYHGVDYGFRYRLGVFLTALDDPAKIIYRSPNPILEPTKPYEIGVSGESWVPNVVFTCGAVSAIDKDILDENDEILVYYGGADTVIGVATARVADLIPARFRQA